MDVCCPQGSHREEIYPLASMVQGDSAAAEEEQGALIRLLSMPPVPQEPQPHRLGCFAYFQAMVWLILSVYLIQRLVARQAWLVLILVVFLLILVLFAEIGMYARLRARDRVEAAAHARERKSWEQAREKWERLYYCKQHGIVFDPRNAFETCEPAALHEFLGGV